LFCGDGANTKAHLESSTTIGKSTDSSLMRHSLIIANSSDGDPFIEKL